MKFRAKPVKMLVYDALSRRVVPHHPKISNIKERYANEYSGFKGEQSLEYYLEPLSEKRYHFLHGIRLANGPRFFQLDTVLLSSYFILNIETKNYTGSIYLDANFKQVIQEKGNQKKSLQDPVSQVSRQVWELQKWLKSHRYPDIPIISLSVFTNPNCILINSTGNKKIYEDVSKPGNIVERVKRLEELYHTEKMDQKTTGKLFRLLVKSHTPPSRSSILAKYGIKESDIQTGVQCPTCYKIPMQYHYGEWICSACGTKSKNAHVQAIRDYFLLIKPTITNAELRQFLHISHEKTAQRILKALKLPFSGERKARVYYEWGDG
ncbi:nuclease-related domain-containing protein [Neobacillus sp. D3-1R]|uniref:nuclease-related domain-containing protein n=1 Tax=Neobacillus sp. D3-1R TaxID=3445778 RepID=UPI003F9F7E1B